MALQNAPHQEIVTEMAARGLNAVRTAGGVLPLSNWNPWHTKESFVGSELPDEPHRITDGYGIWTFVNVSAWPTSDLPRCGGSTRADAIRNRTHWRLLAIDTPKLHVEHWTATSLAEVVLYSRRHEPRLVAGMQVRVEREVGLDIWQHEGELAIPETVEQPFAIWLRPRSTCGFAGNCLQPLLLVREDQECWAGHRHGDLAAPLVTVPRARWERLH